jgi:hypothetical protein
MTHVPNDSATALLSAMKPDLDLWASGEELDFEAKYGSAIHTIGAVQFLTAVFRTAEGSTLSGYLSAVAFLWKDLPFSAWQDILYGISGSNQAVYQFVWFASPFLRMDVLSMIRSDPKVEDSAREFIRLEFPSGAPAPARNWEREVLRNSGIDPMALWRRLASEGAPMKIDLSELGLTFKESG